MPRYFAFLRAINVGGNSTVKMDILRQIFEAAGFSGVQTYIASGNVVFDSLSQDPQTLETEIEKNLREGLGFEVDTFIRTGPELGEMAGFQPFPQEKVDAGGQVHIILLTGALDEAYREKLAALNTGMNEFQVHGREVFWLRRMERGANQFSSVPLEKALPGPFTIRSARTIQKMAEKYAGE